jgi:hypothetical protein
MMCPKICHFTVISERMCDFTHIKNCALSHTFLVNCKLIENENIDLDNEHLEWVGESGT